VTDAEPLFQQLNKDVGEAFDPSYSPRAPEFMGPAEALRYWLDKKYGPRILEGMPPPADTG